MFVLSSMDPVCIEVYGSDFAYWFQPCTDNLLNILAVQEFQNILLNVNVNKSSQVKSVLKQIMSIALNQNENDKIAIYIKPTLTIK